MVDQFNSDAVLFIYIACLYLTNDLRNLLICKLKYNNRKE